MGVAESKDSSLPIRRKNPNSRDRLILPPIAVVETGNSVALRWGPWDAATRHVPGVAHVHADRLRDHSLHYLRYGLFNLFEDNPVQTADFLRACDVLLGISYPVCGAQALSVGDQDRGEFRMRGPL